VWQLEQTPVTSAEQLPGRKRIKKRISTKMPEDATTFSGFVLSFSNTLHRLYYLILEFSIRSILFSYLLTRIVRAKKPKKNLVWLKLPYAGGKFLAS
jgi:type II secretory pathway component PulF